MKIKFLLIILLLLFPQLSNAAIESRELANPEQQVIYENLISELRCLVCQNQTIGESNADLASDLRRQVYEMLQQGQSKQDILLYMANRYGDFVLYNPPFKAKTSLLWLGPVLFLVGGLISAFLFIRHKKQNKLLLLEDNPEQTEKLEKIRSLLNTGDRS